jgi:hypothetical protein
VGHRSTFMKGMAPKISRTAMSHNHQCATVWQ